MIINIFLGDTNNKTFEQGLHPESQTKKVKEYVFMNEEKIETNSAYVLEAINKFHKNIDLKIYYNGKEIRKEDAFSSLYKPFEKLLFE